MLPICEGENPTPSALNINPQAEAWGYRNKACLRRLRIPAFRPPARTKVCVAAP
ncbi:MAG: hypothetical protein WA828_03990 [Coleofasciculaceae cyanobacterium]